MITEIRMPQLGVSMETGTVDQWHKQVGDSVKAGEVLLSIETEKLTHDITSESDGVLLAIVANVGDEVPIQGLLGAVGAPGDVWSAAPTDTPAPTAATAPAEAPAAAQSTPAGRVKASPLARKVAAALGVDLRQVPASGVSGRIKEKDVRAYHQQHAAHAVSPAPAPDADVRERMSAPRRVIARRMTDSLLTAPQVTLTREVNADRLLALRREIKAAYPEVKVSLNDLLVKLLAAAVVREPVLNVSVDGDDLIRHSRVNVGVAVALDSGLLVPVVRDADKKGVLAIAAETGALIAQAREGRLSPDALTGGTVTISNLGSYGVDGFTPIVNLPETAIMGVGRVVKKPVIAEDGSFRAADTMVLSLSFDHRAADGAGAAKLLSQFAQLVEHPDFALL
jgi:pyruvate dehydrogenase E2 component (dihydrolipoamide acetyltransferase)